MNSEFIYCVRSLTKWGRHSVGDELKAKSPGASLSEQVTFNKYKIFSRWNVTIPFFNYGMFGFH
jgi:hypothetical protein